MYEETSTNCHWCFAYCVIIFDWRIGVPLIILYGMAFYLQSSLMGKNSAEFMRIYQDAQETMNHEAVEYIRGIAVVKVFGQTVKSFAKFHNAIETYKKYALAYTMSCKKGMVAFNAIVNSSFLVLVPIGFLVGFTTPTLRDFIQSFLFYVIFSPACAVMLNKIMYMTSYKMQAEESMRRIDMILTSKQQPEPAIPQYPDTYEVAFEDVTFAYDNTDHPAVSHLTFMAKAGAITALVGHSGSGKSTAASLIPRFYDVQDGAVKIGGVDIREIPQGDLMKMVAFVFQDPKLFKDSLLENIRAGRPSATREEVLKAAHLAQCDDILKKLPNGIDTIIGSQGIYLSGGETQRISIARAILKDAPIVVLDEATAYADPENEHQIQKAFDGLIKNKTVIMVAHRLSTVQDADQISTVSKLAARFWDADSGLITLGGIDVKTVEPEVLLKNYAIVFQNVTLFDESVMENIRLGRSGASDEDVRAAAKAAQCDEFIDRLPQGYDTNIGENGSKLSGGERQRISIARALLKNAPVILLDEATASMDAESETMVQTALSALLKGRTVIVIAHRMRTIANADKIVVLDKGKVTEVGTPSELAKKGGLYAHLVALQQKQQMSSLPT